MPEVLISFGEPDDYLAYGQLDRFKSGYYWVARDRLGEERVRQAIATLEQN